MTTPSVLPSTWWLILISTSHMWNSPVICDACERPHPNRKLPPRCILVPLCRLSGTKKFRFLLICVPASSLELWAILLCRLCCLFLDKFVGVLSAHFSQRPSLVRATHPRDQLDWTATVLRQCIPVTSEHTSSVPSACSNCTSILLVTRLTQWHLDCVEPRRRLTKRIRQKKISRQCQKKEGPSHPTVGGCRSRRLRAEPRFGVIFPFLPSCICFCRVRNIEVLTVS